MHNPIVFCGQGRIWWKKDRRYCMGCVDYHAEFLKFMWYVTHIISYGVWVHWIKLTIPTHLSKFYELLPLYSILLHHCPLMSNWQYFLLLISLSAMSSQDCCGLSHISYEVSMRRSEVKKLRKNVSFPWCPCWNCLSGINRIFFASKCDREWDMASSLHSWFKKSVSWVRSWWKPSKATKITNISWQDCGIRIFALYCSFYILAKVKPTTVIIT